MTLPNLFGTEYNHVFLYSEVSTESISKVLSELRHLEQLKWINVGDTRIRIDVKPVALHVHSPGGDLFAMQSLLSFMASTRLEIAVIVDGLAASAAALILASGKKRFAAKHSLLLLHQQRYNLRRTGIPDNDLQNLAIESAEILVQIEQLLVTRLTASRQQILDLLRRDVWLTAEQALKIGLIDGIVPNVSTKAVQESLEKLPKLLYADSKLDISQSLNDVKLPVIDDPYKDALPVAQLLQTVNTLRTSGLPASSPRPVLLKPSYHMPLYCLPALQTAIAQSYVPVVCMVESKCDGGCMLISQLCHQRFMYRYAIVTLDFRQYASSGDSAKDWVVKSRLDQKYIAALVKDRTKLPEEVQKALFDKEFIFNAQDALKYGICDYLV